MSTKPLAALQSDLTAFRDYLAAERGMAKNTVLAYQPRSAQIPRLDRRRRAG